jgi:hypothetical protein
MDKRLSSRGAKQANLQSELVFQRELDFLMLVVLGSFPLTKLLLTSHSGGLLENDKSRVRSLRDLLSQSALGTQG